MKWTIENEVSAWDVPVGESGGRTRVPPSAEEFANSTRTSPTLSVRSDCDAEREVGLHLVTRLVGRRNTRDQISTCVQIGREVTGFPAMGSCKQSFLRRLDDPLGEKLDSAWERASFRRELLPDTTVAQVVTIGAVAVLVEVLELGPDEFCRNVESVTSEAVKGQDGFRGDPKKALRGWR